MGWFWGHKPGQLTYVSHGLLSLRVHVQAAAGCLGHGQRGIGSHLYRLGIEIAIKGWGPGLRYTVPIQPMTFWLETIGLWSIGDSKRIIWRSLVQVPRNPRETGNSSMVELATLFPLVA